MNIVAKKYRSRNGTVDRHTIKDFREYLDYVQRNDSRGLEKAFGSTYQKVVRKAAMSEQSGTAGGYTVPPHLTHELMVSLVEDSWIYPRAHVIPTKTDQVDAPLIDCETAPASGVNPFTGGIAFKWGFENTPTETEPTFRNVSMTAWDLLGYVKISNQMHADMGAEGERYLFDLFGKAASWQFEYAVLRGTGTAQQMPLGILNSNASAVVVRQFANIINQGDIAAMSSHLIPQSWNRAVWAAHPSCMASIGAMATYQQNQYFTGEASNHAGYLMNRPLFVTDKLPQLGTKGDLMFFDPYLYVIADRQQVMIDTSTHEPNVYLQNQTMFKIWLRMGGRPMLANQITDPNLDTNKLSPYVVLN
jgi:HK97 family phage major capsid protein